MDADRKKYTFEHWYNPVYSKKSSIITKLFDFDNMVKKRNGYEIVLRKDLDVKQSKKMRTLVETNNDLVREFHLPIRLSGDADYEMKDENGQKAEQMHFLPNFSLMPVTCNWNIVKGTRPLKEFLEKDIKKYYDEKELINVPYRKWGRPFKDQDKNIKKEMLERKAMKAFLDMFDSIDEYCKNIYFLSYDEIQQLNVTDYWGKRYDIAKQIVRESEMKKDISSDEFK